MTVEKDWKEQHSDLLRLCDLGPCHRPAQHSPLPSSLRVHRFRRGVRFGVVLRINRESQPTSCLHREPNRCRRSVQSIPIHDVALPCGQTQVVDGSWLLLTREVKAELSAEFALVAFISNTSFCGISRINSGACVLESRREMGSEETQAEITLSKCSISECELRGYVQHGNLLYFYRSTVLINGTRIGMDVPCRGSGPCRGLSNYEPWRQVPIPYSLPIPYRVHTCPRIEGQGGMGEIDTPHDNSKRIQSHPSIAEITGEMCSKTGVAVWFTHSKARLESSSFLRSPTGAVQLTGRSSSLFVSNVSFAANGWHLQHNLVCTGRGNCVEIDSLDSVDGLSLSDPIRANATSSSLLQRWGDEEFLMIRSDVGATLNEEKRVELDKLNCVFFTKTDF
ncbi:hypothetical protein BLNAU_3039 [Blattamonas nauphoetae]|uniref:Uncharacterized protein n=1 Tax=Blattamonas nauphoetae TaxID=2049346 RepID=A0ABQ9YDY2_9EUKA|nr:hypothetical protein BLNAU_3039 [Blattamonas nauphoetae]